MWVTIETTVSFDTFTEVDLAAQFGKEHPEWKKSEYTTGISYTELKMMRYEMGDRGERYNFQTGNRETIGRSDCTVL